MVLNAIYEGDFVGFSYGFRPGRGPHDALDALSTAIKIRKVNWVLDADIQNFFGSVSQDWLGRFLEHRIGDKRIIRLIQKWLKAGIHRSSTLISFSFARMRSRRVFRWSWNFPSRERPHEGEAQEREGFRLSEPTPFAVGRCKAAELNQTGLVRMERQLKFPKPVTHRIKKTTCAVLFLEADHEIVGVSHDDHVASGLVPSRRMHQPIPEQGRWLRQVTAGRFAYYAVPTNSRALSAFRHYVTDRWRRTLRRRSQRDGFTWERMTKLVNDWLPRLASFIRGPTSALTSNTQGRSRMP
jgi:RNA-directed DNA polymerase